MGTLSTEFGFSSAEKVTQQPAIDMQRLKLFGVFARQKIQVAIYSPLVWGKPFNITKKIMRKLLPQNLLTLALSLSLLQALQGQNSIRGLVQDSKNQGLAAATALLRHAGDSSLVKGVVCSDQGVFLFDQASAGHYLVEINMLGYAPLFSKSFTIHEKDGVTDLGNLTLSEDNTMLDEVSVVAKRPFLEQKIDRTVVNVANSITNAGGTALEVLQRSPGVQVNSLTKTISLLGKEGVVLMINGKISRLPADAVVQMLDGMNANNIDRIELIHTPPANFEAQGNAGIINIVLKNAGEEGLNGGYSANAGYGRGEKYGAGAYFNYRKKKVNWFGNYEYNFDLNPQVFTNYRGVQQNGDFLETETYSNRPHTPTSTQNARLGADFQLSKKTVLGVLGTFFDRDWYMEAENDIRYSRNGVLESRLQMPNKETNHSRSFAGNINLTHQISKSQSLNFDADIIQYDINNPSHYFVQNLDVAGNITPQYQLRIDKKTPIHAAVAKADYAVNFGEKLKLETGAKITAMRFDNDVKVDSLPQQQDWVVIPALTSVFHLNEDVAGAYATFSATLNPKTEVKAGLRYEYTDTNLGSDTEPDVVDRQYGSWFPSVFVTRKLAENQSLNFSYSRRISRPQIRWLAPWLIFSDPTTVEGGNPALQPSFTNAVKLDYGYKSWKFGVAYSIENAPMRFVPSVDPVTNRQINFVQNLDNEKVANANLYFPLKPTKWWEMGNNLYVNGIEINFVLEGQRLQLRTLTYGFNSTHTFTLPKRFTLEVSGNFDSPGYWGVAKWKATGSANIGIQKDFGQKWGKLRLSVTDLFLSTNWYGTTNQPDLNLMVRQSYQMAERPFMLSWTNTFGNQKVKSARQRQTGSAEEMRRL
jgi:outer membrane receptor protein involved in Fe transport